MPKRLTSDGGDSLTNKCSCGAEYRDENVLQAHLEAMAERNASFPRNHDPKADNQPQKHERVE